MIELLKEIQFNIQEESKAVSFYIELLSIIKETGNNDELISEVEEIISDELHHIQVLHKMFIKLSEIEPNKE